MVRSHVSTNILKLMLWQEFSEKLQSINARMMLIEAFCEIALKTILDGNLLLLLLVVYCCCMLLLLIYCCCCVSSCTSSFSSSYSSSRKSVTVDEFDFKM